jgi:DNA-binding transcriptional ArsR family regulator
MDRTATWRFRMRALAGVGGRADVLAALMAVPDRWANAASLSEVGIAKRNIARALSELADGGVLRTRSRGNVREFQVRKPQELAAVTGLADDAFFPRWSGILGWMVEAAGLCELPQDKPATARVEIARHRRSLDELSKELGFDEPGVGEEAVVAWTLDLAHAMADGTSRVVGGTAAG